VVIVDGTENRNREVNVNQNSIKKTIWSIAYRKVASYYLNEFVFFPVIFGVT
jgi:hypothetical protein